MEGGKGLEKALPNQTGEEKIGGRSYPLPLRPQMVDENDFLNSNLFYTIKIKAINNTKGAFSVVHSVIKYYIFFGLAQYYTANPHVYSVICIEIYLKRQSDLFAQLNNEQ